MFRQFFLKTKLSFYFKIFFCSLLKLSHAYFPGNACHFQNLLPQFSKHLFINYLLCPEHRRLKPEYAEAWEVCVKCQKAPPPLAHEGCTGRNTSVSTLRRSSAGYWQQGWWHGVAWARTKVEGMARDKGVWTATCPTPASVCTHRHPGPLSSPLHVAMAQPMPTTVGSYLICSSFSSVFY